MRHPEGLVSSVDEIYNSLILVELKCIEDNNNTSVGGKQVAQAHHLDLINKFPTLR
jgi:hypothetical protein